MLGRAETAVSDGAKAGRGDYERADSLLGPIDAVLVDRTSQSELLWLCTS